MVALAMWNLLQRATPKEYKIFSLSSTEQHTNKKQNQVNKHIHKLYVRKKSAKKINAKIQ